MIDIIYRVVFALLLFKLTMTLYQRKYNDVGSRKRFVSLLQSLLLGCLYSIIAIIRVKAFNNYLVYVAVVVAIGIGIILRKKLFPYRSKCTNCNGKLKIEQILFIDSQKCLNCSN